MFTGDRSGDVLYAALHAVGLASQPTSVAIDDGLELYGVRITAPVRCAPPENKPTPDERDRCRPWLARELALLRDTVRAVVVLGGFGWQALLPAGHPARGGTGLGGAASPAGLRARGARDARAGRTRRGGPARGVRSYHVSQQNTFTGRLTPAMLEDVLAGAARAAGLEPTTPEQDHPGTPRRLGFHGR